MNELITIQKAFDIFKFKIRFNNNNFKMLVKKLN